MKLYSPSSIFETATVVTVSAISATKDRGVTLYRNDWMAHLVCPIRYSSGNRKIQTISTKCQYRPIISTGVYQRR